ncbi:hypothetical protein ACJX0J_020717, partial [Zea mays]
MCAASKYLFFSTIFFISHYFWVFEVAGIQSQCLFIVFKYDVFFHFYLENLEAKCGKVVASLQFHILSLGKMYNSVLYLEIARSYTDFKYQLCIMQFCLFLFTFILKTELACTLLSDFYELALLHTIDFTL